MAELLKDKILRRNRTAELRKTGNIEKVRQQQPEKLCCRASVKLDGKSKTFYKFVHSVASFQFAVFGFRFQIL